MANTLYIETVGCQMNVLDSELVVGSLKRKGYRLVDTAAEADAGSTADGAGSTTDGSSAPPATRVRPMPKRRTMRSFAVVATINPISPAPMQMPMSSVGSSSSRRK